MADDRKIPQAGRVRPSSLMATGVVALFGVATALLLWRLYGYADFAAHSINLSHGIDFGEGIVWQQLLLIPGPRMYGDIHTYPYIVFHYTPLFHLVVRLLAEMGADVLAAGRTVSVLSTLAAGAIVFVMSRRLLVDQGYSVAMASAASLISALLPLTFKPIWHWSVLLKSDSLALALTLGGFALVLHSVARPRLAYVGMILFVMAVYSKQTFIAAPAAAFAIWLVRDPRVALRFMLVGLGFGGTLLALLTFITDGGFVRHIFLYNINPYSVRALLSNIWTQQAQSIYALLAAVAFIVMIARSQSLPPRWTIREMIEKVRRDDRAFRLGALVLYTFTATAMVATMGKSGASFNYLMEWFAIACVAYAALFAWCFEIARRAIVGPERPTGRLSFWGVLLVPVLLSIQIAIADSPVVLRDAKYATKIQQLDELVSLIRDAPAPVLSDNMVALMRAGREVPLESAIFHDLTVVGVWDQRPFVAMVDRGAFAFIVTDGDDGSKLYEARYTPEVRDAIRARYPVKRLMGSHVVHFPAE